MNLETHNIIKQKLEYFVNKKRIPHIIFHGPSGSGKREILNWFINKIYSNKKNFIKTYVMYVNCAHIKGIRFIRDELKFFAKTNIQNRKGQIFKSIILFNADQLTTDAQSALRRCIELFSHTTRFFIVITNKNGLLIPILSRFCSIYIPLPVIDGESINLYKYKKDGRIHKNHNLKDYYDENKPSFFYGIARPEDIEKVLNHKGKKYVIFSGGDIDLIYHINKNNQQTKLRLNYLKQLHNYNTI